MKWSDWVERVDSERCDILAIVRELTYLKQESPSRQLSLAITKLEEAEMWLQNQLEVPDGEA